MNQDWDRLCEELRAATEPPGEAVAELHRRVLASTRRRPVAAWLAGLAAAAVLLAVLLWPRPAALETLALERPPAPVAPAVSLTPKPPPRAPVRAREAAWIRIETPDPNVVILLIADTGDAE